MIVLHQPRPADKSVDRVKIKKEDVLLAYSLQRLRPASIPGAATVRVWREVLGARWVRAAALF